MMRIQFWSPLATESDMQGPFLALATAALKEPQISDLPSAWLDLQGRHDALDIESPSQPCRRHGGKEMRQTASFSFQTISPGRWLLTVNVTKLFHVFIPTSAFNNTTLLPFCTLKSPKLDIDHETACFCAFHHDASQVSQAQSSHAPELQRNRE